MLERGPSTNRHSGDCYRSAARAQDPRQPNAANRADRDRASESAGYSGAIFFVDVANGPALVVKVYPRDPSWRMAKEVYVSGLLSRAPNVLAPRFLAADDSGKLLPFRYSVMTRLERERLALCEERMSESELVAIWRKIGALMRLIHQIPMEAFGTIADGRLTLRADSNRAYMDRRWRRNLAQFCELGGEESLAEAMEAKWSERVDRLELCAAPKLCHYDMHPGNLMAKREGDTWRLAGVFDFEDAFAGIRCLISPSACISPELAMRRVGAACSQAMARSIGRAGKRPSNSIGSTKRSNIGIGSRFSDGRQANARPRWRE